MNEFLRAIVVASLSSACVFRLSPVGANPPLPEARPLVTITAVPAAKPMPSPTPASVAEYRVTSEGHFAVFEVSTTHRHDKYDEITLERGLTQDSSFANWASSGSSTPNPNPSAIALQRGVTSAAGFAAWASGTASPPPGTRSLTIERLDATGRPAATSSYGACVATAYRELPDLDAGGNARKVASLILLCR